MIRTLVAGGGLVAVYLLALASVEPWDVAIGAALAAVVLLAFRHFLRHTGLPAVVPLRRVLAFFPFALVVLKDIVVGTWRVARIVLHLQPLERPGIVAIPIGERSHRGVVVSAFVATLSPGEFLVDVDVGRELMLLHVLDARDPDAVRARLAAFYDRWQRPVFP